jgi:undecaprenyl phosphate-alpha-L-ara4N flippase subunit ArnE
VSGAPPELSASLGAGRILGLLTVALILGGGQMLFKMAAERLVIGQGPVAFALSFVTRLMLAALALYGVATVLWVYLLNGLPLSRAYPFIGLVFAFVPLLSWLVFRDALDIRYVLGLALMLAGLYLVASGR